MTEGGRSLEAMAEQARRQKPFTPEQVASQSFAPARRGFDPTEVQTFLGDVADELRTAWEAERELVRRVEELEGQLAKERSAQPVIDEAFLLSALGTEAATILRGAHDAAEGIRTRAEEQAAGIVQVGHDQATVIRRAAEGVMAKREAEADVEAATILDHARAEALAAKAVIEAEAAELAKGNNAKARELVEEALAVRERVLGDLSRRKRVAQAQIEQLRAGRERLLDAYRMVRSTLEDVTDELQRADAEARAAQPSTRRSAGGGRVGGGGGVGGAAGGAGSGGAVSAGASGAGGSGAGGSGPLSVPAGGPSGTVSLTTPVRGDRTRSRPESRSGSAPTMDLVAEELGEDDWPASGVRLLETPGTSMQPRAGSVRFSPALPTEGVRIIRDERPTDAKAGPEAAEDPAAEGLGVEGLAADVDPDPTGAGRQPIEVQPADGPSRHGQSADGEPPDGEPADGQQPVAGLEPDANPEGLAPPTPPAAAPPDAVTLSDPELADQPPGDPRPAADTVDATPGPETAWFTPAVGLSGRSDGAEGDTGDDPLDQGPNDAGPVQLAGRSKPAVDELFARLRASRAEAVARAEQVLAPDGAAGRSSQRSGDPAPDLSGTATAAGEDDGVAAAEMSAEMAEGVETAVVRGTARRSGVTREVALTDEDEALLQRRDVMVDAVQAPLSRKLKRALQDEQNALLDRLRGLRQRPTVANVLPGPAEQAERYRVAAMPFLGDAAGAGAHFLHGGDHVGDVDDLAADLAAAITGPLRLRLERAMANDHGDDTRALADEIGAAYREWKSQRIEDVAGDHVTAAFGRGVLASLEPGTPVRWIVDDQTGACPDCDDNALARPTAAGQEFPTGQQHPPAHVGCRCLVVPDEQPG